MVVRVIMFFFPPLRLHDAYLFECITSEVVIKTLNISQHNDKLNASLHFLGSYVWKNSKGIWNCRNIITVELV